MSSSSLSSSSSSSYSSSSHRFDRAVTLNAKLGDAWAHYFAFEYVQTFRQQLIGDHVLMVEGGRDDDRGGIDSVDDAEEDGEDDREEGVVVVVDGTKDGIADGQGQGASDSAISSTTEAMTDAAVSTSSSSSSSSSSIAIAASALKGEGVLSALQRRCAEAAPNEGDLWCSVTKETKLRR